VSQHHYHANKSKIKLQDHTARLAPESQWLVC
jgi:hypothetical protein